ncbi:hypothetical protein WICMUC_003513 [Wickerhamomyces mucosus]|uniref:Signal recognition particle subunit SRP68 n=1 Tax=Wickerhamomyces mucosus TaxID=1378264 RepID=A0A9P8PKC0_9ASCO|nr:hypothetical protein WICMUC_003513 [Wickerhamomyces mucosus]
MSSPLALTFGARSTAFLQSSQDYKKQRITVTRRIHKLKKYLQIQSNSNKGNYRSHQITQEEYDSNDKFYLLNLLLAERDYLYALELQKSIANENIKSRYTLILTRLKKALKYSEELVNLSSNSDPKHLEILIYKELLHAYYAINNKKWDQAINSYSIARIGLQYLDSKDEILYKDIIEEVVDESFKLAIYRNLKLNSIDLNEFSKKKSLEKLSTHEIYQIINSHDPDFLKLNDNQTIKQVQWRLYNAKIKDELTSRLITKVSNVELNNLESYDLALGLWQDSLDSHQSFITKNIDRQIDGGVANDDEEGTQDDEILLAYIKYNILITRIDRDSTLLNENKTQTLRILQSIDETLQEILELPGVYSDDELVENLQLIIQYYKALQLYLISEKFANKREYSKSLLLSSTGVKLLSSQLTLDFRFLNNDKLQKLKLSLSNLQQSSQVLSIINENQSYTASNILGNSTDYHKILDIKHLAQVPIKPVLFDLAFNYISYTQSGSSQYAASTPITSKLNPNSNTGVAEDDGKKKSGFFGLFGR